MDDDIENILIPPLQFNGSIHTQKQEVNPDLTPPLEFNGSLYANKQKVTFDPDVPPPLPKSSPPPLPVRTGSSLPVAGTGFAIGSGVHSHMTQVLSGDWC